MVRELVTRPVDFFSHNPNWLRQHVETEEFIRELESLGDTLENKQICPIIASPTGVIWDGNRRFMVARRRRKPTELEAILTDEEPNSTEIQLITSLQNVALGPYELYLGAKQWLETHPSATAKQLAAMVGRDPSWATKVLSFDRLRDEAKEKVKEGKLTLADQYALSKVGMEEQLRLLHDRLNGTIKSRDDLESHGRKARNGNGPAARAKRIKIDRPDGSCITITNGEEISLEEAIELLSQVLAEMRKAEKDGLDAPTYVAVCKSKAKAGG